MEHSGINLIKYAFESCIRTTDGNRSYVLAQVQTFFAQRTRSTFLRFFREDYDDVSEDTFDKFESDKVDDTLDETYVQPSGEFLSESYEYDSYDDGDSDDGNDE